MDILIFFFIAIILYPVLGVIFGILLTLYKSGNLKLKIAMLTIFRPLVFTTVLALLFRSVFDNSLFWISCFFVVVIARDLLLGKARYLSKLTHISGYVSIEYINAFFQTRHFKVPPGHNKEFKLSDMESMASYPASLSFVHRDTSMRFIIFNKEVWDSANADLHAAARPT